MSTMPGSVATRATKSRPRIAVVSNCEPATSPARSLDAVCTGVTSAATSTLSCTWPTCRTTSPSERRSFCESAMSRTWCERNPAMDTSTVYVPGSTVAKTNIPASFERRV